MIQDLSILVPRIQAPGGGVQGTMGVAQDPVWGAPVENLPESHQPVLDKEQQKLSNTLSTPPSTFLDLSLEMFPDPFQKKSEKNLKLRETFDPVEDSQNLAYLEPAVLAKKILSKTKYDPKYAESLVAFFLGREKSRDVSETFVWKRTGEVDTRVKTVANPPPLFSEFGRTIGVSEKTLKSWAKNHPEFGEAFEVCEDIIQEFMITNGLSGEYSSQFGIFTAKNITKMKDVQVNKNENYDMKSILDQIEKGQHGIN